MKTTRISVILSLALVLISASAVAQNTNLLDGKRWSYSALSGMNLGSNQGGAYYDGKLYQLRVDTKNNQTHYYTYDIANGGPWEYGATYEDADNHCGSASFGKKIWKTSDGYAEDCSKPFLYATGHFVVGSSKKEVISVVDLDNSTLVARLTFPNLEDDAIACYDFDNDKVWMIGYPSGVGKSPWTIREFNVSFSSIGENWTETKVIDYPTFVSETVIGGPGAGNLQTDLSCGALQDCCFINGKIYFLTGRGSSYHRTEYMKIHCYNTTTKQVESTVVIPDCAEGQALYYDNDNDVFYVTTLNSEGSHGNCLWKYAAGSTYDNLNFQPAVEASTGNYVISNGSQLCWFLLQVYGGRTTINATLSKDIDMSGIVLPTSFYVYEYPKADGSRSYEAQYGFRGTFDGANHKITNFNISKTPYYNTGLFPYVIGATIKDVTVSGSITLSKAQNGSGDYDIANVGLVGTADGECSITGVNVFNFIVNNPNTLTTNNVSTLVGNSNGNDYSEGNTVRPDHSQHTYDVNGICLFPHTSVEEMFQPVQLNGDVYEIANAGQLYSFVILTKTTPSANAKLTADVNMNLDYVEEITEFAGIGTSSAKYSGVFDGNGHKIKGFSRKNNTNATGTGFFNYTDGATIKDLTLEGEMEFTGIGSIYGVGSLVGLPTNTTVENVTSSVNINFVNCPSGARIFGGLFGRMTNCSVNRCRYNGTMDLTQSPKLADRISGIAGDAKGATLNNCLFDGEIIVVATSGTIKVAGIIAQRESDVVTVSNCLSVGQISLQTSNSTCGMICGNTNGASVSNSYYIVDGFTVGGIPVSSSSSYNKTGTLKSVSWDGVLSSLNSNSNNSWHFEKEEYPVPGGVASGVVTIDDYASLPTLSDAKKVIYRRAKEHMKGFISVCLPFAIDNINSNLPAGSTIMTVKAVKEVGQMVVVTLNEAESVGAGVPCFIRLAQDATEDWVIVIDNLGDDYVTEPVNPSAGLIGSFDETLIGSGFYKLNSSGTELVKTTDASHCYQYRAYIKLPAETKSAKIAIE